MELKAFHVAKEMFVARGYTLGEETSEKVLRMTDTSGHRVEMHISPHPKLNINAIKYYYSLFKECGLKHAVLLYSGTITSSVTRIIPTLDIAIELFSLAELQFNIMKHRLVPRHTRVDHKKKNTDKFPLIKRTDPVCKFMGYSPGDIIRIDRADGSLYFRFVK